MSDESHLKALLREFGRALSDAVSESDDVERSIERLRAEGYDVMLLVNCRREGDDRRQFTVPTAGLDAASRQQSGSEAPTAPAAPGDAEPGDDPFKKPSGRRSGRAPAPTADPVFRIDMRDLAFLRSVGIDATRRLPTRRSRSRHRRSRGGE